jgi:hypothetical protein
LVFVLSMLACGCSSGSSGSSTESAGADPTLPPASCDPGTMPKLPEATCVPVGTAACHDGFTRDASGWGCAAVLPTSACAASDRAKLGATTCAPVDDCTAAFPPPGATLVTASDPSALETAIDAAPAGATIAVDAGSYALSAVIEKDLHVLGRCASQVTLTAAKGSVFTIGSGANVDVTSVTLTAPTSTAAYTLVNAHATFDKIIVRGSQGGVGASRSATVHVSSSLILGDVPAAEDVLNGAAGAYAIRAGVITLEDTEVRGFPVALAAFNEGTKVSAVRSVVTYNGSFDQPGATLATAEVGGAVELTDSLLRAPSIGLAAVTDDLGSTGTNPGGRGANLHASGSVLSQEGAKRPLDLTFLVDSGSVSLEQTTLVYESDAALRLVGGQSTANATGSVFRVGEVHGMEHAAMHILTGASAKLDTTAIVDPIQYGIVVAGGNGHLAMTKSLVLGTTYMPTSADGKSPGVALALSLNEGATCDLAETTLLGSQQYGLHASSNARVSATSLFVDATAVPDGVMGGSAVTVDETARVSLVGSAVRGSADAAFVFRSGGSVVGETAIVGNAVVLRLTGAALSQLDAAPDAQPDDAVVFYGNQLRENATFQSDAVPPGIAPPPFKTTP